MNDIKVLVVDDSAFMRKMISNILQSHIKISVVGTARNGEEAIKKVKELSPDVITLDVEMPVMDGMTTLAEIMKVKPIPIVMLSSLTKEGADKTFEALELGAVDFITKPSGSISLNIREIEAEIISKVIQAVKAKAKPTINATLPRKRMRPYLYDSSPKFTTKKGYVVALGTSTGGPRALQQVLTVLPSNLPAPIVIVQHMPVGFTRSLAERLNRLANIKVKEAEDGEMLENGVAYIAPGGEQFRVKEVANRLQVHIHKEENRNGHQPSVDVLFESLAHVPSKELIAVIMTGMGSDGVNGLIEMKTRKPNTIIFSEAKETCVVYGMPQAAEKTKLVDSVLELPDIPTAIVNQLKARGE
ncbi:two-component system, chemotaxis family, response regulator CheB [Amphibacillus marinus]|uniref:Protein-glutamate methylesterase/protein-glutamine glutaminase n=1 Tax=Amphibacillus marinus TaxID=872970 RepID=A0A1H8HPB2_9BACI|nr:chemotaxis response regulator protein-glutamate methylesterase [Amphibacillus marinus]SEN58082.1 two-component system, chemotaxis family, response regulator CheB [Amphibacillus marinus]